MTDRDKAIGSAIGVACMVAKSCASPYFAVGDFQRALESEGFVVVPKEPTNEQIIRGMAAFLEYVERTQPLKPVEDGQVLTEEEAAHRCMTIGATMRHGDEFKAIYAAMLQAVEET